MSQGIAGGEGADGVADFVDGLVDAAVHDLLLEGAEEALDDAIGLRLGHEGEVNPRKTSRAIRYVPNKLPEASMTKG